MAGLERQSARARRMKRESFQFVLLFGGGRFFVVPYNKTITIYYAIDYIVRTHIKSSNGGDSFKKLLENDARGKGEYGE